MRVLCAVAVALFVTGAGVVGAAPAAASTAYTWTGAGDDTSWGSPANWTPAGVPGDGDAVSVQAPGDDRCQAHVTDVPSGLTLTDLTIDEYLFHHDPDSPCLTSISGGSITVSHQLTFHAGVIDTAITVAAGATATVTPGAAHDATQFSEAVTVDGALNLTGNSGDEFLSLTGSPGITVDHGATLTTQGTNRLYANCCNDPAHLTNHGTIDLGGTTTLDAVELDQDALLDATGGATVLTDFAPQTAGPGARWTGSGSWLLGYSSVTTVSGTQTLGGNFSWQLGGNGSGSEEYLAGTFSLAGTGRFLWNGGSIEAAMTVGSGVAFSASGADGPDARSLDGQGPGGAHVAVTNRGTMTWSGGAGWYGRDGSQIRNTTSGVLTLGAGTSVGADCCNTPSSIVNAGGRVVVPAGAGTVTVDSTGYRDGGGTLDVGSGSDLELTGGAAGSLATTTITGGGTVGLAQPVTTSGTETVGDGTTLILEKSGAVSTTGTAATTIGGTGSFAWTGGSVSGNLTVSCAAGQTVSGTTEPKRILVPTGARPSVVTFSGPTMIAAGTTKNPDTIQTDAKARLGFTGALSLQTNTRIAGTTPTVSGTTTVTTGSTVATDLLVSGGSLTGSGKIVGNVVVDGGVLAPGASGVGTLTVKGDLTTTTAATVALDLGSGAADLIAVSGTASLKGILRLSDLGSYQPATGDVVTAATGSSLTATFACTTTAGAGAQTQHWTTHVVSHTRLQLVSAAGAGTSC